MLKDNDVRSLAHRLTHQTTTGVCGIGGEDRSPGLFFGQQPISNPNRHCFDGMRHRRHDCIGAHQHD